MQDSKSLLLVRTVSFSSEPHSPAREKAQDAHKLDRVVSEILDARQDVARELLVRADLGFRGGDADCACDWRRQ